MNLNNWMYHGELIEELPEDCIGFVYLVTNTKTGRMYVGKKLATFSKVKYKMTTLKNGNKKRKKLKSKVESDWKTYYGSSDAVKRDVGEQGEETFTREILHLCASKAACSYLEAREQFDRKVLESEEYYNGQISVRTHGSHIIGKTLTCEEKD